MEILQKRIFMQFGNATFDENYLTVNVSIADHSRLSVTVQVLRQINRMQCYSNLNVHFIDGSKIILKDLFNSTKEVCKFLQDPFYDPFSRIIYDVMRSNMSNRMFTRCPILTVGFFSVLFLENVIVHKYCVIYRENTMCEISI